MDLRIIYKIVTGKNSTTKVTNSLLEKWEVAEGDLYEAAVANTPRLRPEKIVRLDELLGMPGAMGDIPMYVVTNEQKYLGASAILYPGAFDRIKEKIGRETFYALPSSIHEWIVVPEELATNIKALKETVTSVNDEVVGEQDYLSDTVYKYTDGFEIAD